MRLIQIIFQEQELSKLIIDLSEVGESGMKIWSGKVKTWKFCRAIVMPKSGLLRQLLMLKMKTSGRIKQMADNGKKLKLVVNDMPTVMGLGKSDYLILLQDVQEIRPTGGLLTAWVCDNLWRKDRQCQLLTSYTADGLLKGTVNTPEDLKVGSW